MKNGRRKLTSCWPRRGAGPSAAGAAAGIARTKEACPKRRVVTYLRFVFQPVAEPSINTSPARFIFLLYTCCCVLAARFDAEATLAPLRRRSARSRPERRPTLMALETRDGPARQTKRKGPPTAESAAPTHDEWTLARSRRIIICNRSTCRYTAGAKRLWRPCRRCRCCCCRVLMLVPPRTLLERLLLPVAFFCRGEPC